MAEQGKIVEIADITLERATDRALTGETVLLSRDGQPVAAVIGVTTLRHLTEERELLRRLALGELESAAGEGEDLEAVLEDCRLLLEEN